MSHGTSLYIFHVSKKYFQKKRTDIKELMKQTTAGTKAERADVSNYINSSLYDDGPQDGFTFANYKESQDMDYEVMAELWLAYGLIAANLLGTYTYTLIDFYNDTEKFNQFADCDTFLQFKKEDFEHSDSFVKNLRLRRKIEEGEKAKEELEEL